MRDETVAQLIENVFNRMEDIKKNPVSYDALCSAAGLYDRIKEILARVILDNKDRLVFTRQFNGKYEVVTPEVKPWPPHRPDGFEFIIPGEYRDYTQIILDGVVLESDSCRHHWCVSPNGIY